MKLFNAILGSLATLALASTGLAIQTQDAMHIREFLDHSKNTPVSVAHGDRGALEIFGDVRARVNSSSLKDGGVEQLNPLHSAIDGLAAHYDAELSLCFFYQTAASSCMSAHAMVELDFLSHGGFNEGTETSVDLTRAYVGINPMKDMKNGSFSISWGRTPAYYVFCSRVMFGHIMDGIWADFSTKFDKVGNFRAAASWFLVSEGNAFWGYALQAGLSEIADLGIYAKVAFVNYGKRLADASGANVQSETAQVTLGWISNQNYGAIGKLHVYGAWAHNFKKPATAPNKTEAYYIGVRIGELYKTLDKNTSFTWAVEAAYELVGLNSVFGPGIARNGFGNIGTADQTNYKGFRLDAAIRWIDPLVVTASVGMYKSDSDALTASGNEIKFNTYEVSTIFNF